MRYTVMIVALVTLSACSNGSNNSRDTTGMSTGAAGGQVQPGAGGSAAGTDTLTRGAPGTSTITPGAGAGTAGTAGAASTSGSGAVTRTDTSKRTDSARARKRP
jgi:hypothetical protein